MRLCVGLALALLAGLAPRPAPAQATRESEVKAAFLYNFTKFIEWPALQADAEPFRVCIVGDAAFASAVGRIIDGESVQGHPIEAAEPQSQQDARKCGILFIGKGSVERGLRLAGGLGDAPVLVVGDDATLVRQGAAIGFVVEDNRVRFDVDLGRAERAGLKVSSKLLRVARHVIPGGER